MKEVTTDADLHDLLQELFGLGDWDELTSDVPWWKARQHEITKIKRSRTARNVDLSDLALAAKYAKVHGEQVKAVTWLYKLIAPAIRWDNERRRAASLAEVDDLIHEAIAIESDNPDATWLMRLVRARGPHRKDVYDQWLNYRDSLPSSGSDQSASGRPTASSA